MMNRPRQIMLCCNPFFPNTLSCDTRHSDVITLATARYQCRHLLEKVIAEVHVCLPVLQARVVHFKTGEVNKINTFLCDAMFLILFMFRAGAVGEIL